MNKAVQELHVSFYPDYFKEYDYEAVHRFFQQAIRLPNQLFYVIKVADREVGYVWVEIRKYEENPFRKSFRSVYVHQLSLNEEYRSRGFGTRMMEHVYDVAREHGIVKIELDYWTHNQVAESFYRKNGFKRYQEYVYKDLE